LIIKVSILVLLETALIPEYPNKIFESASWFQSLFYWKLLSYIYSICEFKKRENVSILVLLETALIPWRGMAGQGRDKKVSILVLLETALIRT